MRLRFSLRTLLAVILVLACAGSWTVHQRALHHAEREASAILASEYGITTFGQYDPLTDDEDARQQSWPSFSEIRRGRLYRPIDCAFASEVVIDRRIWGLLQTCGELEDLKLQDVSFDPSVEVKFSTFRKLTSLDISRVPLTLHHAKDIAKLGRLESLYLHEVSVTDEWLEHLSQLIRLQHLGISGDVSDQGVKHLSALAQLRGLSLNETAVTSQSGPVLASLRHLTSLDLRNTDIDDDCLVYLVNLPLTSLDLSGTHVTDDGLLHLAQITTLRDLYLENTGITDQGAYYLTKLPNLCALDLSGTRVTPVSLELLSESHALIRDWLSADNTEIDKLMLRRWQKQQISP